MIILKLQLVDFKPTWGLKLKTKKPKENSEKAEDLKEINDKKEENKKAEEYLDALKRLKADFENYRKRIERENAEKAKFASENLILKLLNLKDNFERALEHANNDEFSNGLKMILTQFNKILEEENVSPIESLEKEFDAKLHEAIGFAEGKENLILEELQKGYKLFEKVIRPSKVKIGQGGNKNE